MATPVASYEFDRGETIVVALEAVAGDPGSVSNFSAVMKAVPWGATEPPDDAPIAAQFTVTFVPAAGEARAYWALVLAANASAALEAGKYHAAAKFQVAGGTQITSPVEILIRGSVAA